MNIQAEKLKLIEWLAGLTDQTLIERIKFLQEHQSTKADCSAFRSSMLPLSFEKRIIDLIGIDKYSIL